MDSYRKKLMNDFSFMSYAPIIFISAKTGLRLDRLFELIKYVDDQNAMRISTGRLNDLLADATARVQPPTDKGRRLKIYYMTQVGVKPPHFVVFCNDLPADIRLLRQPQGSVPLQLSAIYRQSDSLRIRS